MKQTNNHNNNNISTNNISHNISNNNNSNISNSSIKSNNNNKCNNSLQFVKIQTPELSKKAAEQIRIAEETKIKEVEEEWQNNLLKWKSKRRQQFHHSPEPNDLSTLGDVSNSGRKIKTFAEIIEERAKSGNRLGFHLQRYIGATDDDVDHADQVFSKDDNDNYSKHDEQMTNNSKSRIDTDYKAHSSTSSGFIQPDSKSHNSLGTHPKNDGVKNGTLELKSPHSEFYDRAAAANNNHQTIDEEIHSISLLDGPTSGQINSTMRQDVMSPRNEFRVCSPLEVDPRNEEISTKSENESDNSAFEEDEDEEQEEEQKHLQRIAFEAKLKAFERLTKPAVKPAPPIIQKRELETPPSVPQRKDNSPITHPPQKPSYDDKDRTILSVSGKRRCSSCKEELGRGAAAFVVESLSLVYHTNCFRCSVCHVNLSNGFRGVDVRVHAGALHCQNCYSKDGLNYSRV